LKEQKIDRHELKEDKFVIAVGQFLQYCEEHKAAIRYGGTALVAVLALVTVYSWQTRLNDLQIEERFEKAHRRAMKAASVDQRNDILKEYVDILNLAPSKSFTPRILFSAAHECFELGRYDDALEHCRKLERNFPSHPLVPAAKMSIGQCLEAAERFEGAIEAFRGCIDMDGSEPFRAECELGIARCHEGLGNLQEAMAAYERLQEEDENSYWGRWAKQRLDYLDCRQKGDADEALEETPEEVPEITQ